MLELRIIAAGQQMPIFDLPAALGRRKAAREVGDTIDGLMAFLDDLAGDPDLEDGGDDELAGDEGDVSWIEWHTRHRHKVAAYGEEPMARDRHGNVFHEDDEEDDGDTGIEDDPRGCDPESDDDNTDREKEDGFEGEFSDPTARKEHRDRIRRTACDKERRYDRYTQSTATEYRLRDPGRVAIGHAADLRHPLLGSDQ